MVSFETTRSPSSRPAAAATVPPKSRIVPSMAARAWSFVSDPGHLATGLTTLGVAAAGVSFPVSAAIGGTAYLAGKLAKNIIFGGKALRPAVFLGVEHLSNEIFGGYQHYNIPAILETLQKLDQTPAVREVQSRLLDIKTYLDHFDYSGIGNGPLLKSLQQTIRHLKPNQSVSIPCSWSTMGKDWGHAMALTATRKENGSFLIEISNGGDGVDHHHKKRVNGKIIYQTTLQIDQVSLENLSQTLPRLARLLSFRKGNSSDKLYKEILPLLRGVPLPPSQDERLWTNEQSGDSCSGYSLRILLRSVLTREEYSQFKTQFLADRSHDLFQGLKSRFRFWEHTPQHEKVLRESVLILSNRMNRHGHRCTLTKDVQGLMRGTVRCPAVTTAGKVASKIGSKFWDFIFQKSSSKGKPSFDLQMMEIDNNLRSYFFKDFKELIDLIGAYGRAKRSNEIPKLFPKLLPEVERIYAMLKSGPFNKEELRKIDAAYKQCLHLMKNFNTIKPKGDEPPFVTFMMALDDQFARLALSCLSAREVRSTTGMHLLSSIQALKDGNYNMARCSLEKAYKLVKSQIDNLSGSLLYEFILANKEFILLNKSHPPSTLEEIDLYAGMTHLFEILRSKVIHSWRDESSLLEPPRTDIKSSYRRVKVNQYFPSLWFNL